MRGAALLMFGLGALLVWRTLRPRQDFLLFEGWMHRDPEAAADNLHMGYRQAGNALGAVIAIGFGIFFLVWDPDGNPSCESVLPAILEAEGEADGMLERIHAGDDRAAELGVRIVGDDGERVVMDGNEKLGTLDDPRVGRYTCAT